LPGASAVNGKPMTLPLQTVLLFAAGSVAGMINVLAGGGSMLTVPTLIFMGVDPITANGTNRVAIVVQNATAVYGFRRRALSDFRLSFGLALAAVPGAALGAFAASHMEATTFQRLLSLVLVLSVIALFLPSPVAPETDRLNPWRRAMAYPLLFGIGFYGGFIQIGVGFIFMAALQRLLRLSLLRVNVHKVFIIMTYTVPALAVYVWQDQVDWPLGIALATGMATGAWAATHVAVRGGERWIRVVVAAAVALMAVKLLIGAL